MSGGEAGVSGAGAPAGGDPGAEPTEGRRPGSGSGAIYDLGYQHYDGERLGRTYAIRSLFLHGLGVVFAVGRSARARAVPLVLSALIVIPAVVQAAVAAYTQEMIELVRYENYFLNASLLFALFCAAQAPELVSADRRNRTLVLYLARALRRSDYVLARVGSLATAVFALALVPQLVLFAGRVFAAAEPWGAFRDEASVLGPIVASSTVVALLMATISVAIASWSERRGLAAAAVIGFFLITTAITELLMEAVDATWNRWFVLGSPYLDLGGLTYRLFGAEPRGGSLAAVDIPPSAYGLACLAWIAAAAALLWIRYRRIEA